MIPLPAPGVTQVVQVLCFTMNTNNIFDAKVLSSFTEEGLSHKIDLFSGACDLYTLWIVNLMNTIGFTQFS